MPNIVVEGLDQALALLATLPEKVNAELQPAVEASLLGMQADLAHYPTQNAASKYVRTGTLGRTWTSTAPQYSQVSGGFTGRIGNATPYAPYVQDADEQNPHNSAWPTVQATAEQHTADVQARVEQAIRSILASF